MSDLFGLYGERRINLDISTFSKDQYYSHTLLRLVEECGTNRLYDMIQWEDGKVKIWRQEEGCFHCHPRFRLSISLDKLKTESLLEMEAGFCANPKMAFLDKWRLELSPKSAHKYYKKLVLRKGKPLDIDEKRVEEILDQYKNNIVETKNDALIPGDLSRAKKLMFGRYFAPVLFKDGDEVFYMLRLMDELSNIPGPYKVQMDKDNLNKLLDIIEKDSK